LDGIALMIVTRLLSNVLGRSDFVGGLNENTGKRVIR
jgi:hypothetical protein